MTRPSAQPAQPKPTETGPPPRDLEAYWKHGPEIRKASRFNATMAQIGSQRPRRWRSSTLQCLLLTSVLFIVMLWLTLALFGLDDDDPSPAVATEAVNAPLKKTEGAASSAVQYIPSPRATVAYAVSLTSCGTGANRHDNIKVRAILNSNNSSSKTRRS